MSIIKTDDYVINVSKLNKIQEENIKSYEFIIDILNKYLSIMKDILIIENSDYMKLHHVYQYKLLLENTLLQEGILVKKRVSKIEKILNEK
jgi:hypothetical protein